MVPRFLVVLIVLFWLGSLGWLFSVVWAPPESRMAGLDVREVYQAFFRWNDSARMSILENGIRRGELVLGGGSGVDKDTGLFTNHLSLFSDVRLKGSEGWPVTLRGNVEFDDGLVFHSSEFSARVPAEELSARLEVGGQPVQVRMELSRHREVVFEHQVVLEHEGGLLSLLSPVPGQFQPILQAAASMQGGLQWMAEARRGVLNFAGREIPCYWLRFFTTGGEFEIRAFLSEAGEPLKIETDLGFEVLSEALVPFEAWGVAKENKGDT